MQGMFTTVIASTAPRTIFDSVAHLNPARTVTRAGTEHQEECPMIRTLPLEPRDTGRASFAYRYHTAR